MEGILDDEPRKGFKLIEAVGHIGNLKIHHGTSKQNQKFNISFGAVHKTRNRLGSGHFHRLTLEVQQVLIKMNSNRPFP